MYIGSLFSNTTVLFTMQGGEILNNAAAAGGIMLDPTPNTFYANRIVQFDMDSGVISGNRSTYLLGWLNGGAGVYANKANSFFNIGQGWNDTMPIPTITENISLTKGEASIQRIPARKY